MTNVVEDLQAATDGIGVALNRLRDSKVLQLGAGSELGVSLWGQLTAAHRALQDVVAKGSDIPVEWRRQHQQEINDAKAEADAHARQVAKLGAENAEIRARTDPRIAELEEALHELTETRDTLRSNCTHFSDKATKLAAELEAAQEEARLARDAYKALQADFEGRMRDGAKANAIARGRRQETLALLQYIAERLRGD